VKPGRSGRPAKRGGPRQPAAARATDVWIGGRRAVTEAIRAGRAKEVLASASSSTLSEIEGEARARGVGVARRPAESLDELAPDHQGVVARVALPRELREIELRERALGPHAVVVVLDGITDPQNFGAAARSAEAAGVAALISRERRSAPLTPAAVRASAGALLHLPVVRVTNLTRALQLLQARGFTVVGLDEDAPASIFDGPAPDGPLALVVGAEGSGISRLVRETCDLLVALPMRGKVQSLNASASLAAALFAYVLPSRAG
jgi:23S rRNA (guanosine2251-2'-O)-methyltransferase